MRPLKEYWKVVYESGIVWAILYLCRVWGESFTSKSEKVDSYVRQTV